MEPMKPMAPMGSGPKWWPDDLGQSGSSGGQNDVQYAFFPDEHWLAIQKEGKVTIFDSSDHQISGVQQQQRSRSSLAFSSQKCDMSLDELAEV